MTSQRLFGKEKKNETIIIIIIIKTIFGKKKNTNARIILYCLTFPETEWILRARSCK